MEISGLFCHFRFYVKSILENLEVLKLPFAILGALNFVDFAKISLQQVQKLKFSSSKYVEMADFAFLESRN